AAFGGAVGLVSCCDIAIGSHNASFCLSEVKIGLIPATISPYVIAAMGERQARRYFLTAERFSAATAYRIGLLSECCDPEDLDSTVDKMAASLLKNGPRALKEAKSLVLDYRNQEVNDELIKNSSARIASTRTCAEGQEGLGAFLEKRSPSWVVDDQLTTEKQKPTQRVTDEGECNVQ
ncbi:MAG: enoyl-CoA hydratase-related protein, partial [Gammaproteobacteria bacterium]|nr:enoyl-CoA hydratase-related protein [Gammaproteobacteria bacterium]